MFKKRGFTLIELVIALTVLGLLFAGGLKAINTAMENSRIENDRQNIKSVVEVLEVFVKEHNRLPTQTEFLTFSFKGFSSKDVYYYSPPALQSTFCSAATSPLVVTEKDGTVINNIGFVVVTNGTNTILESPVVNNTIKFFEFGTLLNSHNYDDIYAYKRFDELKLDSTCPTFNILNQFLHSGIENSPYQATISAEGGSGSYTYSLQSSNPNIVINSQSGTLSYSLPISGSYPISVSVDSPGFQTISKNYVLVINSSSTGTGTGTSTGTGTGTSTGTGTGTSTGTNGNSNNSNGNNGGNGNGNSNGNSNNSNWTSWF